ncbi:MAG: cellulase family glycosylhydrolase [Planctomycetales bacterium]|nr:cellulase family glycosylhydrolase [Planctomycetales bacterium]
MPYASLVDHPLCPAELLAEAFRPIARVTMHCHSTLLFVLLWPTALPAVMPSVTLSEDGRQFELSDRGVPFVPWGFNYDHDRDGQLLEEYWIAAWDTVASDFAEMKQLGANIVRVHLQFGRFIESPTQVNETNIERLRQLIALAESTELYLDITGLGCYHKADVPAWYDELDEPSRWRAQATFWAAVAEACASSPAIFCYDLMNEPVVPGGTQKQDHWLGPAFGDKHFVQFITRERRGRERSAIARQWIRTLVAAIRKYDRRHLITVGLVPWSLDRPGLTSGFIPSTIAPELDFIAVHMYPQTKQLSDSLETLRAFRSAGKLVVIEEMFPLRCSASELGEFIEQSRGAANGWIGFYWGVTPDEYRELPSTIPHAMTLAWLDLFAQRSKATGE